MTLFSVTQWCSTEYTSRRTSVYRQCPCLNVKYGGKMQHSKCHLIPAEFRVSFSFNDANTVFLFFWNFLLYIVLDCINILGYLYYPNDSLKFWSSNVIKVFHFKWCQIRSFSASPLLDNINKYINEEECTILLKFDWFYPRISFLGNNLKSWFGKFLLSGIFHLKYVFYAFLSV